MANTVSNNLLAFFTTPESSKKTSMKESMEWKNIFDKSMLEMFKNTGRSQGHDRQLNESNNTKPAQPPENRSANNVVNHEEVKSSQNQLDNKSSHDSFSTKDLANNQNMANQNGLQMHSVGLSQLLQTIDSSTTKLTISSNNYTSSHNMYASSQKMQNPSLARIHFSVTEEGAKVYVRNHHIDDDNMIELVKEMIGMFKHKDYAIHSIEYNGKSLTV